MVTSIREEIENKVIDWIALGSGGRLVVFKPDDSEKDLVVEKKGGYKNKVIFLNIYEKINFNNKDFGNEIRQLASAGTNLKAGKNFYLLFVNFDIIGQKINDNFLMIPYSELKNLSEENDFSRFLTSEKDFIIFLISEFEKK